MTQPVEDAVDLAGTGVAPNPGGLSSMADPSSLQLNVKYLPGEVPPRPTGRGLSPREADELLARSIRTVGDSGARSGAGA